MCRVVLCPACGKFHSIHSTGDISGGSQCSWIRALWSWLCLGQCRVSDRCSFCVCELNAFFALVLISLDIDQS